MFGALGTLALSVAVSQLGIEPQGMKQVIEIVREPGMFAASLVAVAVLAPIVEELVFRGLLYGWIAGRWGDAWRLVVSSLAFAAAHFEPAHVMLVLPLGLLFGWLRRRTDSLLPSLRRAHRQQRLRRALCGGCLFSSALDQARELAVDEVEPVLAPEALAVDHEERRAEHALSIACLV